MRHFNIQSIFATVCLLLVASFALSAQEDTPPNPEFGKCYAKCNIPAQYETLTEQILVKDESKKMITKPAEYRTETEQMLAKEASKKIVPVPAVYETVTEQILAKPADKKLVEVPAVYETMTERILVSPESGRWVVKYDAENCFSSNKEDCTIKCYEKIPAQYKTVEKRVLKTPASVKEIEIPAEYKTVTKQVVKTPATYKEVEIPAEYKTVSKQVMVSPAQTMEETIPAEYKTITKTQKVSEGGSTGWEEIVCQADVNSEMLRNLQNKLKAAGHYNGAIDGRMGGNTKIALSKYQEENGLPVGNLNIKTLKQMGLF